MTTAIGTWDYSLCQGRIEEFITQNLPSNEKARENKALSLCAGCPCMMTCADTALKHGLTGMVAAGEALPDGGSQLKTVRTRLRNILAGKPRKTYAGPKRRPEPKPKPGLPAPIDDGKMRCQRCTKPVRPRTASVDEFPDTVCVHARGLCRTCWLTCYQAGELNQYADRRNLAEKNTPTQCIGCHQDVRPRGTTLKEYPGTKAYSAIGMCVVCYRKRNMSAAS